jgi:CarD family transcriptional regulator
MDDGMEFSVGDKVVHPHHGPGRIARIERKEVLNGAKRYYVIEIPSQGLTVYVPRRSAHAIGVRRAMRPATRRRVLSTLRSRPRRLPEDYRERQEVVAERLVSSEPLRIARVVRDLAGHRRRAHLTRRDTDLLNRGIDLLATEIALVTDQEVDEVSGTIKSVLNEEDELAAA